MSLSDRNARLFAAVIAVLAWGTSALRYSLTLERLLPRGGTALDALGWHLSFFTNATALLVAVVMSAAALGIWPRRGPSPASVFGATALYAALVAAVYHALLASMWNPRGWTLVADVALHTALPTLTILFWLAFAPKRELGLRHAFLWLAFPLLYFLMVVARGSIDGWYPYFFLHVGRLGVAQVLLNACAIAGIMLAAGLAMIYGARLALPASRRARAS